jgi:hypothetical protein
MFVFDNLLVDLVFLRLPLTIYSLGYPHKKYRRSRTVSYCHLSNVTAFPNRKRFPGPIKPFYYVYMYIKTTVSFMDKKTFHVT